MAAKGAPIIIRRKKIVGGHGHHGGAWKVAYADFVTAMMAFFLVMWLMGSDEDTKAAISHYFNHPNTPYHDGKDPESKSVHPMGEQQGDGDTLLTGMGGNVPDDLVANQTPFESSVERNQELAAAIREVFGESVFEMEIELDYLKFSIPEDMVFQPNSSLIKTNSTASLDRIGSLIQKQKWFLTISVYTAETKIDGRKIDSLFEASILKSVSLMNYLVSKDWMAEDNIQPRGARLSTAESRQDETDAMKHRVEFILHKYKGM